MTQNLSDQALSELIEELDTAQRSTNKDPVEFTRLINRAVEGLQLTEYDFAEACGAAPFVAKRWLSGKAPDQFARASVLLALLNQAKKTQSLRGLVAASTATLPLPD